MNKIFLSAFATVAALGLSACDSGEPVPTPSESAATDDSAAMDTGAGTDTTTVVTTPAPGATATTDTGDTVTVGEDGITADLNGSDTSVRADVDGDPSITVKTD